MEIDFVAVYNLLAKRWFFNLSEEERQNLACKWRGKKCNALTDNDIFLICDSRIGILSLDPGDIGL